MTLYRIGPQSPLVPLLIEAAEAGKQVAVLVELKARFDERNNIIWARQLESHGIHVVYGFANLKTHAKLCLVVRQGPNGVQQFVHTSTGNYNPTTARIYTDIGLITLGSRYRVRRGRRLQPAHRVLEPDRVPRPGRGAARACGSTWKS